MKKCVKCETELPLQARFCLNCGVEQSENKVLRPNPATSAADGSSASEGVVRLETVTAQEDEGEFNWLAREAQLDPTQNYDEELRRLQSEGWVGKTIGCLGYVFFAVMGLLALIPGVPLLAFFGLPLALILGLLTFFNIGKLYDKLTALKISRRLPGLNSTRRAWVAVSLSLYIALASGLSVLLMALSNR